MSREEHWDAVYRTKADAELSWFQESPARSLEIIDGVRPKVRRVVDVGGGQSVLAGVLADRGLQVTVVDISASALERARVRAGAHAGAITWVVGDIAGNPSPVLEPVDFWHDRAVFHFLTDRMDRRAYVSLAGKTVLPGGHALVATFASNGPERCSGLPVQRYEPENLAREFAPAFELASSQRETHLTPWGKHQEFVYMLLRRTA